MTTTLPTIALPGQLLGPSTRYAPGPGTHIHNSQVYASIAGPVASTSSKPLPLLSVSRPQSSAETDSNILPEVDSLVLARVTRLGQRFATIEILAINELVCRTPFTGLIRREDVRATEKDKIKIEESFRVGDIVRGTVVSLGDQSNYYVATDRNELGVVMAESERGNIMYPVSWKEFRDPVTGGTERRKVAKPL